MSTLIFEKIENFFDFAKNSREETFLSAESVFCRKMQVFLDSQTIFRYDVKVFVRKERVNF